MSSAFPWVALVAALLLVHSCQCAYPRVAQQLGMHVPNSLPKDPQLDHWLAETYPQDDPHFRNGTGIQVLSWDPRIFVYRGFLSDEECEAIKKAAGPRLYRSGVVDAETGMSKNDDIRTSKGMFFSHGENPTVKSVEERLARITMTHPMQGEGVQVLKYNIGEKYGPHHDYFSHDQADEGGGNRLVTALMYLANVEEGGETVFPKVPVPPWQTKEHYSECAMKGLANKPRKGDVTIFWSIRGDGTFDHRSLHGSCPVIQGEKWSATKWIHIAKLSEGHVVRKQYVPPPPPDTAGCINRHKMCEHWAESGECIDNAGYMMGSKQTPGDCIKACNRCEWGPNDPAFKGIGTMESIRSFSLRKLLVLAAVSAFFLVWALLRGTGTPPCVVTLAADISSLTLPNSDPWCPSACAILDQRPTSPAAASRLELSLRQRFANGLLDLNPGGLATFTNGGVSATWVPMNGFIAAMLSHYQRLWGISGAAGEIGVHWADYFLPIAVTCRQNELLWVLDVFEQQEKNIDKSGLGDYNIFMSRCSTLGLNESNLLVSKMASTEMTPERLCTLVPQRFRFLSIDGGHSRDTVYSDLVFAECQLADGGIAAMDDYSHAYWPGVHEGVVSYFDAHKDSRLAPFLLANNKLYITTKTHHLRWLGAMIHEEFWGVACLSQPFCIEAPGKNGGNFAKFQLAGYGIAVAEHRSFNLTVAHAKWIAWLNDI